MPARTPLVLSVHHAVIICSDYERSKRFYAEVLGLEVVSEVYREARRWHKLDLRLPVCPIARSSPVRHEGVLAVGWPKGAYPAGPCRYCRRSEDRLIDTGTLAPFAP